MMNHKSIFRLPIARVFTADKQIDSRLLNSLGVQVVRQVSARMLLNFRNWVRADAKKVDGFAALKSDGLLVVPNFLPQEQFRQLRDECLGVLADESVPKADLRHGPTLVRRVYIQKEQDRLPIAAAVTSSQRVITLLSAAEGKALEAYQLHRAVERVVHGDPAIPDPENDLHVDTFHSTHKLWLYLDDVAVENGPLAVVPRSHLLDIAVLRRTYRYFRGIVAGSSASRRVDADELAERELAEVQMTVAANTLVIANTGGYHRRIRGIDGAMRSAVHVSARSQPFLFWVNAAGKSDY